MKIKKIFIKKYKILENIEVDFSSETGEIYNTLIIAGINGSGKTTFLKFIKEFLKNMISGNFIDILCEFDNPLFRKNESIKLNNTLLNNIFTFKQNESIVYFDTENKPQIEKNATGLISEINRLENKIIYFDAENYKIEDAQKVIFQFVQKSIFQDRKTPDQAYKEVQDLLDILFEELNLQITFDSINANYSNEQEKIEVFFKNESNNKIPLLELSTGEKEIIAKAFYLEISSPKNSVILIDEIERSLHPNWQNNIINIYQRIAKKNNNQLIIATHSPHIVASVKKEQIRVFVKNENKIEVISNFSGSYGWRIDKVLLEIFRLSSLRNPVIENELEILNEMLFNDEEDKPEFIEKIKQLENILGFDDIDLTQIRFQLLLKKKSHEKN